MIEKTTPKELLKLKLVACQIRQDIVTALLHAKSGHSAGSLGMADIFAVLYFHILKFNSKEPKMPSRDRLVLSCGHINPVLYATLARAGFFPVKEFLMTLRKINSRMQGHPHNLETPGVENSSGPLGQGLSQAAGMALAAKLDNKKYKVYCVMSDGEQEEGQTWEAAMFAGKNKLGNLVGIIDRNRIQIDGCTEDVMPLEPLKSKYESFNWQVFSIDGNNMEEIIKVFSKAARAHRKPVLIIANTVPGKGVEFMEGDYKWHGIPPNKEQAELAIHELRTLAGQITEGDH